MQPGGYQPGDVSHVRHEYGAGFIRYMAEALEIDDSRVGAGTGDYHFRFMLQCQSFDFRIIDAFRFLVESVGHDIVIFTRKVGSCAMRQVPSVGEVHPHDGIPRIYEREIDRHVCLRSAMRLHIGMFGVEKLFGAVYGDCFNDIYVFATAVIAFAGISLGIFVSQESALCL